jgi:hypothetical protein
MITHIPTRHCYHNHQSGCLIIRLFTTQPHYLSNKPKVFTDLRLWANNTLTFHIWCHPRAAQVLCTISWPHSQCMLPLEFQADVRNQSHITLWHPTVIQEHSLVSHHGAQSENMTVELYELQNSTLLAALMRANTCYWTVDLTHHPVSHSTNTLDCLIPRSG